MAIDYRANYTGQDLNTQNKGYDYISREDYLQDGFKPNVATFNISPKNYGIVSQYPQYPIIPQFDGGDGGPTGPTGPGYGYTGPGSTGSPEGFNIDDIGEGTIDDEDMPTGPGFGIMDAIRAGGAYMFGGPLGTANSLRRSYNRNKQAEIDEINKRINEQYGPGDPGLRGNNDTPGFGKTAAGNYTNQFDGGDPGQGGGSTESMSSQDEMDAGGRGSRMAYGGRAGYSGGGVTNYKNFLEKKRLQRHDAKHE